MHIVGGCYREVSSFPPIDQLFGSGGRAAYVVAGFGEKVHLTTCIGNDYIKTFENFPADLDINLTPIEIDKTICFEYYHGLSKPVIRPTYSYKLPVKKIKDNLVLQFGMLELSSVIECETAVYDPQSSDNPIYFDQNGSTANKVIYILNRSELFLMTDSKDESVAISKIFSRKNTHLVVLKCGAFGAKIFDGKSKLSINAYKTPRVWPIGSGDVFASTFAYYYCVEELNAKDSARMASRAAALYCSSGSVPINKDKIESKNFAFKEMAPQRDESESQIYLAGPFFNMPQLWLVNEARNALLRDGHKVFSPYHDVGIGEAEDVVHRDIAGIEKSNVVLALCDGLDSGTIFEVGYAVKSNIKVVAFVETATKNELKMLEGSGCIIFRDFTSAIYNAEWMAMA